MGPLCSLKVILEAQCDSTGLQSSEGQRDVVLTKTQWENMPSIPHTGHTLHLEKQLPPENGLVSLHQLLKPLWSGLQDACEGLDAHSKVC